MKAITAAALELSAALQQERRFGGSVAEQSVKFGALGDLLEQLQVNLGAFDPDYSRELAAPAARLAAFAAKHKGREACACDHGWEQHEAGGCVASDLNGPMGYCRCKDWFEDAPQQDRAVLDARAAADRAHLPS